MSAVFTQPEAWTFAPKHANRPKRRSKGGRTTSSPRVTSVFWWKSIDKKGGAA